MLGSKTIERVSDLPKAQHWAIIEEGQYTIPGDERSRTNPGHGYPESTERYLKYHTFENEEQVILWIEQHNRHTRGAYRVIQVTPVSVEQKVQLVI